MQKVSIFIFLFFSSVLSINASEQAVTFIEKVVNESLNIVNHNGTKDEEKRQRLSESINQYLDLDRIAYALFAHWQYKDLSKEDMGKVKVYLKKYLLNFYAGEGKLSMMVNARLVGKSTSEAKSKDFAVTTKFSKGGNDNKTTIVWITNGNKIYYVEIEGINQIITLRSEMKSAIGSRPLMEFINEKLKTEKTD